MVGPDPDERVRAQAGVLRPELPPGGQRGMRPSVLAVRQQVSVTGLGSPFGSDAVQWKIRVVTGWKMSSVMSVSVSVGLTPVQFGFGHPATAALTVGAAVNVAGLVVNVRFPFLIALAGIAVSDVAGPARTLFCPGSPPFLKCGLLHPVALRCGTSVPLIGHWQQRVCTFKTFA